MRGSWAIAVLLLVVGTTGCGVIEGLGSFSEGPCTGGACDASTDAGEDTGDGGPMPASDATTEAAGGDAGDGSSADVTAPPDVSSPDVGSRDAAPPDVTTSDAPTSDGPGSDAPTETSTTCGPSTCSGGCCSGNTCVPYAMQSGTECGTGGGACESCGTGDACTNGMCTCGGSGSCTGCCNGSTCVPLTSETNTSCGANGAMCAGCTTGQECDTATGHCVCDSNTCPNGCCNGNTCVLYSAQNDGVCGVGGAACSACGQGQACDDSNGKCVCNTTSCTGGCCSGNTCIAYASQNATQCGASGATCGPCPNGLCDTKNGTCSCDSNTCPDGCCSGGLTGTCESYTSMSVGSCGSGGAACAMCPADTCCSSSPGGPCATQHDNGVGQNYYDCNPLYSSTNPWTAAAALEACAAFTGSATKCSSGYKCGSALSVCSDGFTSCDCWEYQGSLSGHVDVNSNTTCFCVIAGDPTWD